MKKKQTPKKPTKPKDVKKLPGSMPLGDALKKIANAGKPKNDDKNI